MKRLIFFLLTIILIKAESMREIKVGQTYRHYKGKLYKVVAIAVDTEVKLIDYQEQISDAEKRVIYHAVGAGHHLSHDILWDRSYEMFTSKIVWNGKEQYRFEEYTESLEEMVVVWKDFFQKNNWQQLINDKTALECGCGLVYEIPNVLNRDNESIAIADMRTLLISEPHYHPEIEVYYIVNGNATVVVGHEEQNVTVGDIVIIPPYTAHFTIPDDNCIIAVVSKPAFNADNYTPIHETSDKVSFDYQQFAQLKKAKELSSDKIAN